MFKMVQSHIGVTILHMTDTPDSNSDVAGSVSVVRATKLRTDDLFPRLDTSVSKRDVSIMQWVKNKLSSVKGILKPEKNSIITKYFKPFIAQETIYKELKEKDETKGYLEKSDLKQRLERFYRNFSQLDKKENIFKNEHKSAFKKVLKPDRSTSKKANTSADILEKSLEVHDIHLARAPQDELNVQLSSRAEKAFKKSSLFKSYQLYLAIQGAQPALAWYRASLENQSQDAESLNAEIKSLSSLITGLCHILLKTQMPKLFSDGLYTTLNISDTEGNIFFRSDTIQPRGGVAGY